MKYALGAILSIVLILSIILGFSAYAGGLINTSSKSLESHVSAIEKNVNESNWDNASKEYDLLTSEWENTGKTWSMLLDHFEIDNIETTMSRVSKYIEVKDLSMSLAETALLQQYIKHIPEKEKFNFKNVF